MKTSEIKIDLEELKKFKIQNAKDRLNFVKFWADYIRTHNDKEWSRQQNILINSQIQNARALAGNR
jgi:hypothetical protein